MSVSIKDLEHALIDGGDLSAYADLFRDALGDAPIPVISRWDVPLPLPDASLLAGPFAPASASRHPATRTAKPDIRLVPFAPHGRNIISHLERAIRETAPDVIALDVSPTGLSEALRYAFSLGYAIGLPVQLKVGTAGWRGVRSSVLHQDDTTPALVIHAWQENIPCVSVGPPPGKSQPVEFDNLESFGWQAALHAAAAGFDTSLADDGLDAAVRLGASLSQSALKALPTEIREKLASDACYVASRVIDLAAAPAANRPRRILLFADLSHYQDLKDLVGILAEVGSEIYEPAKPEADGRILSASHLAAPDTVRSDGLAVPARRLFAEHFAAFISGLETGPLPLPEARRLITAITGRTRRHPDIIRPASVRGALALESVMHGLTRLRGRLDRAALARAALITLPPRITTREGMPPETVIGGILQEVLYGISSRSSAPAVACSPSAPVSPDQPVDKSGAFATDVTPQPDGGASPPVVVPQRNADARSGRPSPDGRSLRPAPDGRKSFRERALEYMLSQLEDKLKNGEITQAQFNSERDRLNARFGPASDPRSLSNSAELAQTIMEMLDAQDRQWNQEVNFQTMHVYYHIKANSETDKPGAVKQDYHALKWLIDELGKEGVLRAAAESPGFLLTGLSLELLLKYLTGADRPARSLTGSHETGRAPTRERSSEVRRYRSSDVSRDISVRHTLREAARQKRGLAEVREKDLRVYLNQPRRYHSDVMLCIDTSGSMGFHQELTFARLAAAGLAQAFLSQDDRVGLVAFNDASQIGLAPAGESGRQQLLDAIAALSPRGNTNIGDGLRAAREALTRGRARSFKRIILITDGLPTAVSEDAFKRLQAARERDLTEAAALLETKLAAAAGIQVSVVHIARDAARDTFVTSLGRTGRGRVCRIGSLADLKQYCRDGVSFMQSL